MPKIDWNKIQASNILVLNDNQPIRIKFLDEGSETTHELVDKRTQKAKTVPKYVFNVIDLNDDNKEKELSTLAITLMLRLKPFLPLKNKSLTINKFRTGADDFDVDFRVALID